MPSLDRQRVQALFGACLELDATARDALLHRECAGDDALRAEVEQLLANDTTEDAVAAIIADSATRLDDEHRAWQGRLRIGRATNPATRASAEPALGARRRHSTSDDIFTAMRANREARACA